MHTRIQTNCSALNNDLVSKNMVASPLCIFGSVENAEHFFFHSDRDNDIRIILLDSLPILPNICLNAAVWRPKYVKRYKYCNFDAVHTYIKRLKRSNP